MELEDSKTYSSPLAPENLLLSPPSPPLLGQGEDSKSFSSPLLYTSRSRLCTWPSTVTFGSKDQFSSGKLACIQVPRMRSQTRQFSLTLTILSWDESSKRASPLLGLWEEKDKSFLYFILELESKIPRKNADPPRPRGEKSSTPRPGPE